MQASTFVSSNFLLTSSCKSSGTRKSNHLLSFSWRWGKYRHSLEPASYWNISHWVPSEQYLQKRQYIYDLFFQNRFLRESNLEHSNRLSTFFVIIILLFSMSPSTIVPKISFLFQKRNMLFYLLCETLTCLLQLLLFAQLY